jgi:glutaredoxin
MLWNWLRLWRKPRLAHWRVVLYTRRGCHLCDEAWAKLERARRRYGFMLEAIDVDGATELAAKYGLEVPVVAVNDAVRFRGGVNGVLLERLLRAGEETA